MLSYRILLTISCLPFSLHSMEQKSTAELTDVSAKKVDYYCLNTLYKKAYSTLANYDPADIQSARALSEIITKTKELKTINIQENDLGLFALRQTDSIKDKFFAYGKSTYNGPHYVSVFFARVGQYNTHLTKNEFISPTIEEFALHKNNRRIIAASNNAVKFKLYFDLHKINAEKRLLTNFAPNIAIDEFEHLINDILIMQQTTPDEIKTIAQILYEETLTF